MRPTVTAGRNSMPSPRGVVPNAAGRGAPGRRKQNPLLSDPRISSTHERLWHLTFSLVQLSTPSAKSLPGSSRGKNIESNAGVSQEGRGHAPVPRRTTLILANQGKEAVADDYLRDPGNGFPAPPVNSPTSRDRQYRLAMYEVGGKFAAQAEEAPR